MWRALAFLALLAVAAFGAVWIADRPGSVIIVWNGYEVATSLAIALVGVGVAAIVLGLVWAVVRGLITLPDTLVNGSRERRRAKGFTALSRGMVAVGSGDPLAARRHAGDAERLLGAEEAERLMRVKHMPSYVSFQLAALLAEAAERNEMPPPMLMNMEQARQELVAAIGMCERIAATPLPRAYVLKLRRFMAVYMLILPAALVDLRLRETYAVDPLAIES